jgi:hypothetical protein
VTLAANAPTSGSLWRGINIGLCLAGVLVFGGMLLYLQSLPRDFEGRAQTFIIDEIDEALAPDSAMSKLAQLGSGDLALSSDRVEALRENLAASTRNFITLVVEAFCTQDCRAREILETEMLKAHESIQSRLKPGFDALRGMVEAKYHAVFDELRRDITIFLGANLIVLGISLILALVRGRAARHLAPISIVMTLATLLMAYWYVFGQNWILTIIYSDYFGWSYLVFLAIVCLLLADIGLNRARVISEILNRISDALGSDWVWLPC